MVIQPNLSPNTSSAQTGATSTKSSQRAMTGSETASNPGSSIVNSAALVIDSQNLSATGSEIDDPATADQSLSFLQGSFLNTPALALSAQANQLPASVLQLLQP
jgi:hypothetical protein